VVVIADVRKVVVNWTLSRMRCRIWIGSLVSEEVVYLLVYSDDATGDHKSWRRHEVTGRSAGRIGKGATSSVYAVRV